MKTYEVLVDVWEDEEWVTKSLFLALDPNSNLEEQALRIILSISRNSGFTVSVNTIEVIQEDEE
jgi:hypothetical protein